MALSSTYFKNRILSDLVSIIGVPSDQLQTDLLARAVRMYVAKMDDPYISATIAVNTTTGNGPYALPATLRRLVAVYNNESTPEAVTYSYDAVKRQITFSARNAVDTSENWTAYGTPKEVITNLDTIVAAISEDYEHVLWAYIQYAAYDWQNHSERVSRLQEANKIASNERKTRNRLIDSYGLPNQYIDVQGNVISNKFNAENISADIYDDYGMDL